LSLRPKDTVATFNWDPLLVQAFKRNRRVGGLPHILFLHGNVAIDACYSCRNLAFREGTCKSCGKSRSPMRLLYPVRKKGYSEDAAIRSEWAKVDIALAEGYFFTVFGYSAPRTDVEAIEMLKSPWTTNPSFDLAEVEIVNPTPPEELEKNWEPFIVRHHRITSPSFSWAYQIGRYPRRSCEGLFAATMMNDPWPDHPMPETTSLAELHAWIAPLLDQEKRVAAGEGALSHDGFNAP
jgi:hypothetical protein